jgi:hypothetical protein
MFSLLYFKLRTPHYTRNYVIILADEAIASDLSSSNESLLLLSSSPVTCEELQE